MNMKKIIIAVVVVVVLLAGSMLLLANQAKAPTTTTQTSPEPTQAGTQKTVSTVPAQAQEVIITVTNAGFNPQTVTVKAGTRVIWVNNATGEVTVNAADHPTHKEYPPLNLGEFGPNQSVQLVFDKAGTYKYHNHLDASQNGVVVVQ